MFIMHEKFDPVKSIEYKDNNYVLQNISGDKKEIINFSCNLTKSMINMLSKLFEYPNTLNKYLELREAEDHYVIQLLKYGEYLTHTFPCKITTPIVKMLCKLFDINYDPKWCIYTFGLNIILNKLKLYGEKKMS